MILAKMLPEPLRPKTQVNGGFFLLIIGCWVTFFMGHRRFCVEVTGTSGESRVRVIGLTDRNRLGFKKDLSRLTCRLADRMDAPSPDVSRLSLAE